MSALINKKTCKYVVIDVDTYEQVLGFINRSGGGSFPSFKREAHPVIGGLIATIERISDSRDYPEARKGDCLISRAVQAIRRYVHNLC